MLYHVIIALNSVGQRNVGPIISTLERLGLELVEIRKRVFSSRVVQIPNLKLYVIQYQLNELDAMEWYRLKFSDLVLQKKLDRLFRNHVELLFESEADLDSHELWETIRTEVFPKDRKFPLMFVVRTSGENGINAPFIPDNFDMEILNTKFRTLREIAEGLCPNLVVKKSHYGISNTTFFKIRFIFLDFVYFFIINHCN